MFIAAGSEFSGGKVWVVKKQRGAETQTAARMGGGLREYDYGVMTWIFVCASRVKCGLLFLY